MIHNKTINSSSLFQCPERKTRSCSQSTAYSLDHNKEENNRQRSRKVDKTGKLIMRQLPSVNI